MAGKRLELLRQLIPNLSRVAVFASDSITNPFVPLMVREITTVAGSIGIRLDPVLVGGPADFEQAFAIMAKNQTQAVIVQGLFDSHRRMIIELATRHWLASLFSFRENIVAGGLISYGSSQPELLKRAAVYVDKILKGAKPADLPVEQATKFELVINFRTAKVLDLTVPSALLALADEIIE